MMDRPSGKYAVVVALDLATNRLLEVYQVGRVAKASRAKT